MLLSADTACLTGRQWVHTLIFFDALRVKIRDEELVRNSATRQRISRAACAPPELRKPSASREQNEGAKFGLRVMNELKHRGVADVLIAVTDGLKGFPEAITAVFPQAMVQTPDRGPGQALPRPPAAPQP